MTDHRFARVASLALAGALLVTAPAALAGEGSKAPPLDQAVAQAHADGKPLLVEFYTTWCGPCQMFEAKILPAPEVQAALQDVTFVRYDAEDGAGIAAAAHFGVSAYPTFIAVDDSGEARLRESGAPTEPARFVELVDRASYVSLDEATLTRRLKAAPRDARLLYRAGHWHEARDQREQAAALYARAVRADRGNKLGVAADAEWRGLRLGIADDARARAQKAAVAYVRRYPGADQAAVAFQIAVLAAPLPARTLHDLAQRRLHAIADQPDALNDLSYLLLAVGEKDVALEAAKRQVELRPKEPNPYDSLAEVYHYRGQHDEAIAASTTAIELSKGTPMQAAFAANRARFAKRGDDHSDDVDRALKSSHDLLAELLVPSEQAAGGDAVPPAQQAMFAFLAASRKAFSRVGDYCGRHKGGLDEAYVRIVIGPDGGKPTKVTVLEPGASEALRLCIQRRFALEDLPPPPTPDLGKLTQPVPLGDKAH